MKLANMKGLTLVVGLGLGAVTARAAETAAPVAKGAPGDARVTTADQAAADLREHHRHHNSGGLMKFVAMSLDTLGTDQAKRAQVDKVQSDIQAHMAPGRDAEKELLQAVADSVTTGKSDSAKIDAALAKMTTAAEARRDADFDSLNQLHKILSPEERAALVDKVEAHWEVWRKVNAEANPAGTEHGGRIAELTEEVALTPDQVTKISAALQVKPTAGTTPYDPKRGEKRVQAFATAFVATSFDAKALASKTPAIAGQGSRRMTHFYETAAPLLTPDQRTKLAETLREIASYEPAASEK